MVVISDTEIVTAIGYIAKAIGMTKIAQETGMTRPSLYKALSDGSKPQFLTTMKVLKAVGGQVKIIQYRHKKTPYNSKFEQKWPTVVHVKSFVIYLGLCGTTMVLH